ncbi:MAG: Ectoine utilization protein EutD [Parcubacteria bacterium 34_609]|nr:MAG: Ectoine utilization protein EutD [Parcubacteria bacterium 34_609]
MLSFDIQEYKERIKKTKKRMETEGIEVLFISQPANMNYLTGYDGWSFYVHQGIIVSLDKEDPIWVGRGMDANGARITTFLKDEDIKAYADDYVQSKVKHPMQFVAAVKVIQAGIDSVNIGVRECDAAANISSAQIKGTEKYGGDYPAIVPLMMLSCSCCPNYLSRSSSQIDERDCRYCD